MNIKKITFQKIAGTITGLGIITLIVLMIFASTTALYDLLFVDLPPQPSDLVTEIEFGWRSKMCAVGVFMTMLGAFVYGIALCISGAPKADAK